MNIRWFIIGLLVCFGSLGIGAIVNHGQPINDTEKALPYLIVSGFGLIITIVTIIKAPKRENKSHEDNQSNQEGEILE